MSIIPTIAVVGRPNVGKSSLLNRIVGRRHAIVDPTPGVTRDRNYSDSVWNGRHFFVVDTGGIDLNDDQPMQECIRDQVEFALEEADSIILVCDSTEGLMPQDKEILDLLRKKCGFKPIFIGVNKADNPNQNTLLNDFYELGSDKLFAISAIHGHGVADLLDAVVEPFPRNAEESSESRLINHIAIVGKPNVGKSSLFNKLLGQKRSIIDDVPGTTRDTIIVSVDRNGKSYCFVDTAGLRRPSSKKDSIEFFSVMRALGAIKRSDLAILVLDASEGKITEQDKRIAGRIIEAGSGCITIWNKWDIVSKDAETWKELEKKTREAFPLLAFAPIISCSAKSGQRVDKVFSLIDEVQDSGKLQIPPDRLKEILFDSLTIQPPPSFRGRQLRLSNLMQLPGPPIIFKVKCSEPEALHFSYQRYLLNQIREESTFNGWPVKLVVRK